MFLRCLRVSLIMVFCRFPAAARVVLGSTIAGGISFGVGLGLYRGVTCSLQQARGDSQSSSLFLLVLCMPQ